MHTSPWWIYVIVGALVLCVIVDFYRRVLPQSLDASRIEEAPARAIVLAIVTALLFAYSATPGLAQSDNVSLFIGRTSLLLAPVVMLINWRRVAHSDNLTDR